MLQGVQRPGARAEPEALWVGAEPRRPPANSITQIGKATASGVYRFEDVQVVLAQSRVRRGDQDRVLRQQAFHILVYLLEQRDRVVTKQELADRFWQDTAVTDNALVQCIADIRKALGDDPREPRFIRTVPRVGYQFIAPVRDTDA